MSSERRGDFIVVSCLDEIKRGVIPRIPVHVTLSQWFHMPLDEVPSLKQELRDVSKRHETPVIEGRKEAYFGTEQEVADRSILVREIQTVEGSPLRMVHLDLLRAIAICKGVIRYPEYVGAGYHPHITYKEGKRWIDEGERIALEHFQLIQAVDEAAGKREVLKNYDFAS